MKRLGDLELPNRLGQKQIDPIGRHSSRTRQDTELDCPTRGKT